MEFLKNNIMPMFISFLTFILVLIIVAPIQAEVEEEECVKFYLENRYVTNKCKKYNILENFYE